MFGLGPESLDRLGALSPPALGRIVPSCSADSCRAAITSNSMAELAHSAFRPSGAGETRDKADGSPSLNADQEVIAYAKNPEFEATRQEMLLAD